MKRTIALAVCGFGLAGCSSMPSMPSLDFMKSAPAATTVQFESEPAGAEARTSTGQTCRTPCAAAMTSDNFTVTFTMPGFQPQTVPVRMSSSSDARDPNAGDFDGPRLAPNPVYAELVPAAPPPPVRRRPAAPAKPRPVAAAKPASAPRAAAPAPAPVAAAPAPAPAAAWPPVSPTR